jgi:hypothetical protein
MNEHYWYFTYDGLIEWMTAQSFSFLDAYDDEKRLGREDIYTFVFRK